jgi:hypothetical protein
MGILPNIVCRPSQEAVATRERVRLFDVAGKKAAGAPGSASPGRHGRMCLASGVMTGKTSAAFDLKFLIELLQAVQELQIGGT